MYVDGDDGGALPAPHNPRGCALLWESLASMRGVGPAGTTAAADTASPSLKLTPSDLVGAPDLLRLLFLFP